MPPDYFALLEERRRPWIDLDELKARFLRLSSVLHPDRVHQAPEAERLQANRRYAELNAAHQCLREPKERLFHLLELERGRAPAGIEQVPSATMNLFLQVGELCRQIDAFLVGRAGVTSPLLRVAWFEKAMDWSDQASRLLEVVRGQREAIHARLRELNNQWDTAPPPGHPERPAHLPLAELEQAYRALSYLNRWTAQLQERVVQLAL